MKQETRLTIKCDGIEKDVFFPRPKSFTESRLEILRQVRNFLAERFPDFRSRHLSVEMMLSEIGMLAVKNHPEREINALRYDVFIGAAPGKWRRVKIVFVNEEAIVR